MIRNGGRFIVKLEENGKMSLSFTADNNNAVICDVTVHLFINGDMKYFAQMLEKEGMSTSWCMYCPVHPKGWKGLHFVPADGLWDIAKQQQFLAELQNG